MEIGKAKILTEQPSRSMPTKEQSKMVKTFTDMLQQRAATKYTRARTFFLSKIPYFKTFTGAKADQQLIKQIKEQPPKDLKEMQNLIDKYSENNGKRGVFNKELKNILNQISAKLAEPADIGDITEPKVSPAKNEDLDEKQVDVSSHNDADVSYDDKDVTTYESGTRSGPGVPDNLKSVQLFDSFADLPDMTEEDEETMNTLNTLLSKNDSRKATSIEDSIESLPKSEKKNNNR